MEKLFDFGLVGLGVMGRNFILNVADHGFSALGLDLDPEKVSALKDEAGSDQVSGTTDLAEFVSKLATPRRIMLLVPAGKPVDSLIDQFEPHLSPGDLIIDGGNSFFADTDRRIERLKNSGINFFGAGVSGGAKGARLGPSIMPGGNRDAYESIRPVFEAVSAKVNGEPCVAYMGAGSAGNYVKMVHNGIEYGMMQLISEAYFLLKHTLGLSNKEIQSLFARWNEGRLQSFLIEITSKIFLQKDDVTDQDLVDVILDKAKQKGTGKWTSQNAMDLGISIPTIDAAVSMRQISSLKDERVKASNIYNSAGVSSQSLSAEDVEAALYFSFIITYAQGMTQLHHASTEYGYDLDLETTAKIWRGGCIIRAGLLEDFRQCFQEDNALPSLLLHESIATKVKSSEAGVRRAIQAAVGQGIPVAALAASLNYFDAFKSEKLPMNLIQAQRDFFGSHTYERVDKGGIFHTEWE